MPSVGSATPRSGQGGREVVSASLDGLVSALDGLKSSLGYDDYSTVRSLIEELRTENEELRTYAETAIRVRAGLLLRAWVLGRSTAGRCQHTRAELFVLLLTMLLNNIFSLYRIDVLCRFMSPS